MTTIETKLENKTLKEKANIKALEICKVVQASPREKVIFSNFEVDIEIISIKPIDGGVEVMARAWESVTGHRLGFGKDGKVEIERFRFFNPPILVYDSSGDIIREIVLPDGSIKINKLKNDPARAIKEALCHTMSVVYKQGITPDTGRIGNTVSTFYPAAGATEPVDGHISRNASESWATIIAGTGTDLTVTSTTLVVMQISSAASTDVWSNLTKSIALFDTSAIPDMDNIDSATLSFYGNNQNDGVSITPDVNIYEATPASTSNLVNADFQQIASTPLCDSVIVYPNWNSAGYNDFALNSSGRAIINKTGITKFGTRNANYDVAANAPTWKASEVSYFYANSADAIGTSNDPKLVVTHTAPIYNVTVTDGTKYGDTREEVLSLLLSITDGTKYGDSLINIVSILKACTDGVTFSDAISKISILLNSLSDGVTFSDTITNIGIFPVMNTDGIKLGDISVPILIILSALVDGVTFSDAVSEITGILVAIAEGIKLGDTINVDAVLASILTDITKFGDSMTSTITFSTVLTDGTVISDSPVSILTYLTSVLDTVNLGDDPVGGLILLSAITDGIKLGDVRVQISLATGETTVTFTVKKATVTFTI